MSHSGPSAVNPIVMESPYIPSSESAHSGHSPSPEHPGERVGDSSVHQVPNSLAMQYVNHSNVPVVSTSSGYAYAEHNRMQGLTDVDVDEKPHMVYESMTEVQHMARQRMMNGGNNYRTSTHVEDGSGGAATTERNEKTKRNDTCACILINVIWNVFLLFLVSGAFGLAVFNFLERNSVTNTGTFTTDAPTTNPQTSLNESALVQLQRLNNTVTELRMQLDQIHAAHEDRYNALNASIVSAIQSARNVNATNELDLYMGCETRVSMCVLDPADVGTPPSSASCDTPTRPLTVAGMTNTDIYCSIDNNVGETNPIVASLNIFNSEVKCVCSLIALSNPTGQVACNLHVRRCPDTIQLNTPSTQ